MTNRVELWGIATPRLAGDDKAIRVPPRSGLLRVHDGKVQAFNR